MPVKPGNTNAVKHGGEAAVKAISKGAPFVGLAAATELEVSNELALKGRAALVHQGAQRLETASRLYWQAFCKACDDGDMEKVDRYASRFGWLQSKTMLAWLQSRSMEKDEDQAPDIDAVLSRYRDDDTNDS